MTDDTDGPQGQSAYRRLLADIKSGQLLPGARLRETELAERLGISRTPVREAIRQLEADGLVTHQARQGATIRNLDYAEVIELYEMRSVLEGTASRLAARMAQRVEVVELTELNDALAASEPGAAAQELNRQFHRTLLDAARNRFLVKTMSALQKTLLILGPTTLADPTRPEAAAAEHAAVIRAIAAHDGDAAEAAMRAHVEAALNARIRAMRGREIPMEDE
ncbi:MULTISPECIES: GntR family transcriptional regulator [Paracoccus]|jgi:DNA-binding GntR family transcriptional regulator|uniref:GntR family transcriptional regulator n=1 Tax=Paracoccus haeundaensis TaxID=225362 RepID=A0A5C4R8Z9_9RHOB|nr:MULTISPECIES: GntR family transcriptional regulator [Paracoccus]TYP65919.1 GntR family transcriptional regulator [Stutzerimonas stutzeri]KIX16500.1 GntR family transcriptional regulator [Paracoccus sp. 228]KJZ31355.1 GntR family transcriptional regulator [Paracoccus sp. S4493]MCO6364489.1 FCD domain-containing protein [Paracoccus sp. 08]QXI65394.1 putative D-xylose utilization operon transcriptional repressor [Paracoccus marcusii]